MNDRPVIWSDRDGEHAGVRVIQINRPAKRNALNLETKRLLAEALTQVEGDATVRAVVITGDHKAFVAGTDLTEMAELTPTDHLVQETGRVFTVLDQLAVPTVAAVEGFALGGGCELAMACDLVVAGRSAIFGQPEIRVGLIPGAGGLSRLIHRVGRARALRMVLTGEPIIAELAHHVGIVGDICDDGHALDVAVGLAAAITTRPPLNVRAIRRVARHAENITLDSAIELERATFQLLFDTADHSEGIAAFLEKRPPTYHGR